MTARTPMARRSVTTSRDHYTPYWLILAVAAGGLWGAWELAAHFYRQSHCVLLFGHWIALGQTTIPGFCL